MYLHDILQVSVILLQAINIESRPKDVQSRFLLLPQGSRCPTPPLKANGYYQCTTSVHSNNTVCYLHCDRNYKPDNSDNSKIKCLDSGTWSHGGRCVKFRCSDRPAVKHGTYQCTNHSVGGICNLQCDSGYQPSTSPSRIHCLSSHRWSTRSQCIERKCAPPPVLSNGVYQCSTTSYSLHTECQLLCDLGYKPESSITKIRCLYTEIWSNGGQCVKRKCHEPPVVNHGIYRCTNHSVGAHCHLECINGYKQGSIRGEIHCLASQTWSRPTQCVERKCPLPPQVFHGSYVCTNHSVHGVCHLNCDIGYKSLFHFKKIHCLGSETWSTSGHCLEIECPAPPKIPHGSYHCTSHVNHFDSECHLHCHQGYKPEPGRGKIQCLHSETWSTSSNCIMLTTTSPLTRQTTAMTTRLATESSITQASLILCEVCSGPFCGVSPGSIETCPHGKAYCLSQLEKEADGTTSITKSCATKETCNKRWWLETSDKNSCVKVDPTTIFGVKLSCTYCCTKSECNRKTIPDHQTLFVGH